MSAPSIPHAPSFRTATIRFLLSLFGTSALALALAAL